METKNEMMALYEAIPMDSSGQVEMKNVAHAMILSKIFVEAGLAPKGKDEKQVLGAILAGKQLGLAPMAAMQGIAVINGMPCLWGDAMVAVVKNSGYLEDEKAEYFRAKDSSEIIGVRVTVKRKGMPTPYVGEFSKANAQTAGLWSKQGPWTQYPKRMMFNRARAFAYRDAFADVLKGFNVAEEVQDYQPIETTPTKVSEAPYAQTETKKTSSPKLTADALIRAAAKKAPKTPHVEGDEAAETEICVEGENAVQGECKGEVLI